MNKRIIVLLCVVSTLFLSLAVYLSFFGVFKAEEIKKSAYNQRSYKMEESILRGTIYDRKGKVLAESKMTEDGQERMYPYKKLYTHLIGYSSKTYGKSKLELEYNDYLSGNNGISEAINIMGAVSGEERRGLDINLTVDHGLQQHAYDLLSGRSGAIILMDTTGAIRAMVSSPSFDPNEKSLENAWDKLTVDEKAPFVARAISGLYPPGSTWKIVTAAAAIEAGLENEVFNDEGKIIIGGREYTNSKNKAFGEVNLEEAFMHSSNVVFATIGDRLGKKGTEIYSDFLLSKDIGFEVGGAKSYLLDKNKMSETDIASTAIGQGKLMVTPLYMAVVSSAIQSGGMMIKPYVVESIGRGDLEVYSARPESLGRAVSEETAGKIKNMMRRCVTEGTGGYANVSGIEVYGKTGTAQNETDKSHDWFVGFAENGEGDSSIICVLLEYNAEGSSVAASIAGRLLSYWLR